jgi:hypothetical protein
MSSRVSVVSICTLIDLANLFEGDITIHRCTTLLKFAHITILFIMINQLSIVIVLTDKVFDILDFGEKSLM